MMGLTEEQMKEIQSQPLPPEMQAMIDRSRSDFYAALGPAFDRAIQPYAMILKILAHGQRQIPNRAEKRAETKKKQTPKKK